MKTSSNNNKNDEYSGGIDDAALLNIDLDASHLRNKRNYDMVGIKGEVHNASPSSPITKHMRSSSNASPISPSNTRNPFDEYSGGIEDAALLDIDLDANHLRKKKGHTIIGINGDGHDASTSSFIGNTKRNAYNAIPKPPVNKINLYDVSPIPRGGCRGVMGSSYASNSRVGSLPRNTNVSNCFGGSPRNPYALKNQNPRTPHKYKRVTFNSDVLFPSACNHDTPEVGSLEYLHNIQNQTPVTPSPPIAARRETKYIRTTCQPKNKTRTKLLFGNYEEKSNKEDSTYHTTQHRRDEWTTPQKYKRAHTGTGNSLPNKFEWGGFESDSSSASLDEPEQPEPPKHVIKRNVASYPRNPYSRQSI